MILKKIFIDINLALIQPTRVSWTINGWFIEAIDNFKGFPSVESKAEEVVTIARAEQAIPILNKEKADFLPVNDHK